MELFSKKMGTGTPLLILHGVFGSGDNWGSLGRKWAEAYEVHLIDARNHGHSPHNEAFSYDLMADDLLAYMDKNELGRAHIIGHSMGGKTAMLFAAYNPERVDQLVVADIAPKPYKPHHQKILEALNALDLDNIRSRNEAQEAFAIKDFSTQQFLLKSLYWKEKGKLAWRFNLPVIQREIEKTGTALPDQALYYGPTLFVRGGNSWYIEDTDMDLILRHFPEASLETLKGAGHWLHAEKPEAFHQLVHAFLKG